MEELTENQQINEFENPTPKRPDALSIACVLSYVNAGWQFLSHIVLFLAYNMMKNVMQSEEYLDLVEKMGQDSEQVEGVMSWYFSVPRFSFLILALLFVGSFIGVYHMWNMKKKGFHIYAIAQILILIATAVFVTSVTGASLVSPVILTAIWIGIYFIYYRKTLQ